MKNINNSIWFPPFTVFIAIMVVVVSSFILSLENRQRQREVIATEYAEFIEGDVRQRIEVFQQILRSEVGFISVNKEFTKEDWRLSIEASKVLERFPGIQGIAYTEVVMASEKQTYEQEIRRTVDPTFAIFPEGKRDIYTIIKYLEPQNDRNNKAIGFDMFTEDIRRRAMSLARDNNEVTITDPIILVQENDEDKQFGLILYAPIYKSFVNINSEQQRRQGIDGYVSIVLRTEDFLSKLLKDRETDSLGFSFYSVDATGIENSILYESDNYQNLADKRTIKTDGFLNIKSSNFGITVAYDPETVLTDELSSRSSTVLLFGTFAASLIAGVIYLLLRGKANEVALTQERTVNDAKDSLLSIASHQLRTPATGVKQYLGMVLQGFVGDVSPQQKSMLEKAYESNERQLKTINDVLFLARIDSGRIVLSRAETDIKAMVLSIVEEQKESIDSSGHTIKVSVPKKQVHAIIDEHTIRMTIENLLTNAIKYTRSGGKISISLQQDSDNTTISVKDTGVGIAREDEEKLFKQFSRVKNALSKSVSGTGIGLYLAKHIIELHEGEIVLESELDKGSEFSIVLPR